ALGCRARSGAIHQTCRAGHGPRFRTSAPPAAAAVGRAARSGDCDDRARARFAPMKMPSIRVIDSHTGGEPTRLVLEGGPDLGDGPIADRVKRFKERFDDYRCAIVNEPRGGDPWGAALLVEPHRADCELGVIYFNNVGYLGMCGHGTMGLIASLKFAGRLAPGAINIDTPVGAVEVELRP